MDCLEFRRRVGAEPSDTDEALAVHRRGCGACARYQDELQAMDALIARALALDCAALQRAGPAPTAPRRQRWFAIAASLAAGLALGLALLFGAPRQVSAREVVDHVLHEPGTLDAISPVTPGELAQVLEPDGTRLRPGIGDVTFAARCVFEGHVVPHLVVRTSEGPVTVLMLRHREIEEPMRFDERGVSGVVLPALRGSIAVVDQGVADLDSVASKVFAAIDWGA
jgi:Protein of unknown function (DUF3379)